MRNNSKRTRKSTRRNTKRNNNNTHNNSNTDQQQNIVASRRINKIRDIKLGTKYFYDYGGAIPVVFGGSIAQCVLPKQGFQPDERIGTKILTKRIEMKYVLTSPPSDVYNEARIILVYLPQPTVPTIGLILDGNPATGGIDPLSFTKPYSTGTTHQILYDQSHIMNVSSSNATVHGQISIPCNLPSSWDYVNNFESGYIGIILLGDSSFIPHTTITYNMRSQYVDL